MKGDDLMSNKKYNELEINQNDCPLTDNPVIKGDCSSCTHYQGFIIIVASPCVKCSGSYDPED